MIRLVLLMALSLNLMAFDVSIELDPPAPIKGEPFNLIFKVQTEGSERPQITFTPGNLTVLGKSNRGESIQTTIINGKITSLREYNIVYEMIASNGGRFSLRDIVIEADGKRKRFQPEIINVDQTRKIPSKLYVNAELSKKQYYVGEAIELDYVIYNQVSLKGIDVRAFPKLKGFVKRYLQTTSRPERVQRNGLLYERRVIYKAILYGEKAGKLKIDPIKLRLETLDPRSNPFGFGFGGVKVRNIVSPSVDVKIIPLPTKGMPDNFTGLVGEHLAELNINKNKFLANEAIEMTLKVSGAGALESYEAPVLIAKDGIEEFETDSELSVSKGIRSVKTFRYTYLPRVNVKLENIEVPFSYFDPVSKKYTVDNIRLPDIEVYGSSAKLKTSTPSKTNENTSAKAGKSRVVIEEIDQGSGFVGPMLKFSSLENKYIRILNLLLLIILMVISLSLIFSSRRKKNSTLAPVIKALAKNGIKHKELHDLLVLGLAPKNSGISTREMIANSQLSSDAKKYFSNVLEQTEKSKFKGKGSHVDVPFNKKHFEELEKIDGST